ncbi:MAG TPA: signal peptidase I [Candidatus Saccharimonadales bacterium]|nr:signal peptidase I [Candidatus Saccharimonadales bacterium]
MYSKPSFSKFFASHKNLIAFALAFAIIGSFFIYKSFALNPNLPGDVDQTLAPDEIFVLGDNRGNSEDSRFFGPVKADQIVGKLAFRIVPIDNAKKF